ncbi:TetR family transcriptional regulator [Planomicrobium soli]|uniref:TetR family transcriptional regulator n=2 Tax=Planomicrobium soli TaxID=1176648 RepID=A0A2P8H6I8_9BACL|nr:TetR family transcriptional regulator [Planomicrobium soli]
MLEQGIEGASVRNIAKEAGLSLGSLRYYFHSQEELMKYARELVSERITQRVDKIFASDKNPNEKILEVLLELLPQTSKLGREPKVRLFFKTLAVQPEKTAAVDQDGVYLAVKNVMSNLLLLNFIKKNLDIGIETERLYALINGLALNSLLNPDELSAQRVEEIILVHLNSICKESVK